MSTRSNVMYGAEGDEKPLLTTFKKSTDFICVSTFLGRKFATLQLGTSSACGFPWNPHRLAIWPKWDITDSTLHCNYSTWVKSENPTALDGLLLEQRQRQDLSLSNLPSTRWNPWVGQWKDSRYECVADCSLISLLSTPQSTPIFHGFSYMARVCALHRNSREGGAGKLGSKILMRQCAYGNHAAT